ncbi:MAG: alpha-ribazole phosphatase [Armatimonadota bacterium]
MRIILVRHGETVFNRDSRYQGHMDSELSPRGREQAEAAAERLSGEKIDAVYSSDLSRARETAEAIAARHGLPVTTDPALRECSFGDWEGLTVREITERYPELYASYRRDSLTHRAPGGERLEELSERVVRAVEAIAESHPDETVAVVVHGGPIRAFVCHALGVGLATFRKMHLDNAGITSFRWDAEGGWFLELLNDSCHMREAPAGLDEMQAPPSESILQSR